MMQNRLIVNIDKMEASVTNVDLELTETELNGLSIADLQSLVLDLILRHNEKSRYAYPSIDLVIVQLHRQWLIDPPILNALFESIQPISSLELDNLGAEKLRRALLLSGYYLLSRDNSDYNGLLHEASVAWSTYYEKSSSKTTGINRLKASLVNISEDGKRLHLVDIHSGYEYEAVLTPDRNPFCCTNIRLLQEYVELPIKIHLIDCQLDKNGIILPTAIILDPDFLIDVTAIASVFSGERINPLIYLLNLMWQSESTPALMIGHIANYCLDLLVANRSIHYEDMMQRLFHDYPLMFSLFGDEEVRAIALQAQSLLVKLAEDVHVLKSDKSYEHLYIEPTFLCPSHGIQGRLDLLMLSAESKKAKIVELKSGQLFADKRYGVNISHYIQTLLYDIMIRENISPDMVTDAYLLYSRLESNRIIPIKSSLQAQKEAIAARNNIVILHHNLMRRDGGPSVLNSLNNGFALEKGFVKSNANALVALLGQMTSFEKSHVRQFLSMILTDHYIAKVGNVHSVQGAGFSSLWNWTIEEKLEQFNILLGVTLCARIDESVFSFNVPDDAELANFRSGDIVVIYPHFRDENPVAGQLLKATIVSYDGCRIELRLRNVLFNQSIFEKIEKWNIEHDFLDSSIRKIVSGYIQYFSLDKTKRAIFLGLEGPGYREDEDKDLRIHSSHYVDVIRQIIRAEDYFLLWGPPGTGKTSVLLHDLVHTLIDAGDETLLIVAYTNRAVDEICEVLLRICPDDFVRIGSRYSVGHKMLHTLLNMRTQEMSSREEIRSYIHSVKIVVGTVASLLGKTELFQLKHFDRMIVDEAGQILEPAMLALIRHVPRVLLIGDHKQLPAVVQLPDEMADIEEDTLIKAGYKTTKMSMLERLFRRCRSNGWSHAYHTLYEQGRMHEEICTAVSNLYYDGQLAVLSEPSEYSERLTMPITSFYRNIPTYQNESLDARIIYIDVKPESADAFTMFKSAPHEARCIVDVIEALIDELRADTTIGVICPFRAQIAELRFQLLSRLSFIPENITIDTVERFQGSARDIILISTCSTNEWTFQSMVSLDEDGADRRLNVAISRTKEQIIFVGNKTVLSRHVGYAYLMDQALCISDLRS